MMDRKLCYIDMAILGDLCCSRSDGASTSEPPIFGIITVLITMDYKQLLPVVSSRKYVEYEHEKIFDMSTFLYSITFRGLRGHGNMWMLSEWKFRFGKVQILRSLIPWRHWLMGGFRGIRVFLWSKWKVGVLHMDGSGELQRWFTTKRKEDVRLDSSIIFSTNLLLNEHNNESLASSIVKTMKFYSSTKVEPHAYTV